MSESSPSGRIATVTALAAVVFFGRAWLIRANGSTVPFWDQWDAEALGLYRPWLEGSFRWSSLWQPNNEHRILFTRVTDLLLLITQGRWDLWMQQLVNAALHAGVVTVLAGMFFPALGRRQQVGLIAAFAILFLAPAGWQNALWGFQSPVYYTSLFGLLAVAGLGSATLGSAAWWFGATCAIAALFSSGSGLFAAAAAAGVTLFTWRSSSARDERWWRLLPLIAILAFGAWLRVTIPGHAQLQVKTPGQFLAVFTRCLAWPWVNVGAAALALQLPLVALLWQRWRRGEPLDDCDRTALGIGLFTWLQAVAVAYSRGQGLPDARPLSRYQDLFIPGLAVQVFALLRLAPFKMPVPRVAAMLWGAVVLAGLIQLTEQNLTFNLPYKRAQDRAGLVAIQAYVATGDAAAFTRDPDFPPPHPDPRVIQRVLDDPVLRPILPPALLSSEAAANGSRPWPIEWAPLCLAMSSVGLLALLRKNSRFGVRPPAEASAPSRPPPTA